jgi:hypothetical protein
MIAKNNEERSRPFVSACQRAGKEDLQAVALLLQHNAERARSTRHSTSKVKKCLLQPSDTYVQTLAAASLALDAVQLPACEHVPHITSRWRQSGVQNSGACGLLRPQALDMTAARPQIHRNTFFRCISSQYATVFNNTRCSKRMVGRGGGGRERYGGER